MAETQKNWYVLRAVSGKEAKVKEYIEAELKHNTMLQSHVFQVLIPMEKQASLRNGKRVEKEKISLPGYVFVEADLKGDVAHTLRFMPNVLGFLGGLDNPSPVPQADINRMLGAAENTELENDIDIPYSVDETVKVTDGPFSGYRRGEHRETQAEGDGQDLWAQNAFGVRFYASRKGRLMRSYGRDAFNKNQFLILTTNG